MKTYRVYQVDSFTTEKFRGNPAGVVVDAGSLSERDMLNIARELNNSETAFILPPEGADHDIHTGISPRPVNCRFQTEIQVD